MQFFSGRAPVLLLALASMLGAPFPARAHAIIVASAPAAGATLHGSALPVLLRFNSRIDGERSRLMLLRADGSPVALKLVASAGPDTMAAEAEGLAPGRYRLHWQVLAIDGHITRGDIPFEVVP
ncbi:MAG TPA: copper resistance CopC family protein [Stellaceae bacterium]|nr:copper resistance CopC family protein [Stellaceae bacterium]